MYCPLEYDNPKLTPAAKPKFLGRKINFWESSVWLRIFRVLSIEALSTAIISLQWFERELVNEFIHAFSVLSELKVTKMAEICILLLSIFFGLLPLCVSFYAAPDPFKTAGIVWQRILKSSHRGKSALGLRQKTD